MTTEEQNVRLTRVGPGTPMGELMRRYWQPIAPVAKLSEDPVQKVRVLGEDLVLFRDRSGHLGLIDSRCAHRSVDLALGIPEENGLRCPYHGWCFDRSGQCTDTPLEPANSSLKDRTKITSYAVEELGGLVWAYLGPQPAPVLPKWDFLVWPNAIRQIAVVELDCNWLQCQENAFDPAHGMYLHGYFFEYQLEKMGVLEERAGDADKSRIERFKRSQKGQAGIVIEEKHYGFRKGVRFTQENGAEKDFTSWYPLAVFPNFIAGRGGGGGPIACGFRTPIDDTHTLVMIYRMYYAAGVEAPAQESVPYFNVPLFDENGNRILDHVLAQDWAAWTSQGPIVDRTRERPGSTDVAIMRFRRELEKQMQIVEAGGDPTINFYREDPAVDGMIQLEPPIGSGYKIEGVRKSAWDHYFEGYWRDEVDRYGLDAATPLAIELSRRAAELKLSQIDGVH